MLYLKIIAVGLCSVLVWDAVEAAETVCSTTTIKLVYVKKNGKNIAVAKGKCCQGYVRHKNRCVPVCTTPCENSKCTGPNFCTCNEGYERLSDFRCIPHCEGCDNGFCIRPGYCQCSTGYYHADNGSCLAECGNCRDGYCVEPNVCQCREGYRLGGTEDEKVCEPICEQTCGTGRCTAPNVCTCDEGFVVNDVGGCEPEAPPTTIPEPCADGYERGDGGCVPVCGEVCENGECSGPDQCECYAGFSNENSTSYHLCKPVCANGCGNGDCIAPGNCVCHKGYGKIADECIPLCEKCSLGHCVKPEVCQCDRGYELIDGDCVPICEEECKNAKCTGPNSCTCLPGYNYTDINSLFECLPVCEDDCDNGECVAPNTCECNPGFVKDEDVCVDPIDLCRAKCLNGFCDGSAKCNCNHGYIMNMIGLCEKTCPDGCVNGECIGGSCLCNENYRLSLANSSVCEPICGGGDDYDYDGGCQNGRCVEPNVCQCDEGFDFADGSRIRCQSLEEIRQERELQQKVKQCAKECNGECQQGYCQCPVGYVNPKDQDHRCEPLCEPQCIHGTCILPNRCECDQGYEFYNGSTYECFHRKEIKRFNTQLKQDLCEEKCNNGYCEEGDCLCNVGFRPRADDEYNCDPFCEKPCLNGICAGNNQCRCFEGYENYDNGSACKPSCEHDCVNGRCVEPNKCKCNAGFVFVEGSASACESVEKSVADQKQKLCKAKCSNGLCVDGVCKCSEGFQIDPTKLACEPICEHVCKNGFCSAPGECRCNAGYEHFEGYGCKPICEQDCENGFCGAPDKCECSHGYKREDSRCVPNCGEDGCANGICVAPDTCECFTGYKQSEDASSCQLIPEIIYKVDRNPLAYNRAYITYLVPLVVIAVLITSAIVVMIVLRNKRKDYHVGKLGKVRRSAADIADRRSTRTTDYNDYNLVVLFPTESKDNCVYFMPQPPAAAAGVTSLAKEEEEKFQV
ncbi:fibrillin-1 isoform X1 [Culex quinquefasciatus]|uniref:fibrillin-1 isoform X1 n=1 Tax=Culex quinquefasciatus TaxID=7176 RepID=UPI0018E340F4|nr:fibrillin-1 isoform X1 [Culex quinquefasciatus]